MWNKTSVPPNIRVKRGKAAPHTLPDALSLLGSESGVCLQLTAWGSSAAGTGPAGTPGGRGDTWGPGRPLALCYHHSVAQMLCCTMAAHSSNLDVGDFFLFCFFSQML